MRVEPETIPSPADAFVMAQKRAADEESPSANGADSDDGSLEEPRKRQRTASTQPWPDYNTWRQPMLSPDDRKKLLTWLDKKVSTDQNPFPVEYPKHDGRASNKGKKGAATKKKPENGRFRTEQLKLDGHPYGEVSFAIGNKDKWDSLTKYRRCTVSEQTFVIGACVLIQSGEKTGSAVESATEVDGDTSSQWKGQIHEVRALDENHVYLRVSWLMRPMADLPGGARQHHGKFELVPSTDMDIIDAKCINGPLLIKHWDEYKEDDDREGSDYYWRQSYDRVRGKLSECRNICKCKRPQNPDRQIVQCASCKDWFHAKCIEQAILDNYLERNPGSDAANGNSENGDTQLHPKAKAKAKKPQGFKDPDIYTAGPAEAEGVTASLCVSEEDSGKASTVTVKDTRGSTEITEVKVECISCAKSID